MGKTKIKRKDRKKIWLGFILFLLLLFSAKYIWGLVGFHIQYSEGERSGRIIKISNQGLFWKTWEGEMMVSQKGYSYIWYFSIDNNDPKKVELVQTLKSVVKTESPIIIKYEQKAGVLPWRGGTSYFAKEIDFADQYFSYGKT